MHKTKLRVLSAVTAALIACTAFSGALSVSAFEQNDAVDIGTVTQAENRELDDSGSGLTYSKAKIEGESANYEVYSAAFNPTNSDYMPLVYSMYSGYGWQTTGSGQDAESKWGYDIKAGVNASLYYMTSGSTYGGVNISDGKVFQGSNTFGESNVMAFDSNGIADIVLSKVQYTLKLNGETKSDALAHINVRPKGTQDSKKILYFDTSCGTGTDSSVDGVEVVFEKAANTELIVGGTLRGTVVEVKSPSHGCNVAKNQFVLYAANDSEWAATLEALQVGDTAEIVCEETNAAAKAVMEKANSAVVVYGYQLIRDGEDVSSAIIDVDFNKRRPRSAVGVKADGTVMLIAVRGDDATNGYAGMTLAELTKVLLSQGCVNAFNLDGGGSTQFAVENASGQLEQAYCVTGGPRNVANSLFVVKRPAQDSALIAEKRTTLNELIQKMEEKNLTGEALTQAKAVYASAKSMPGDYLKAIVNLNKILTNMIVTDLPSNILLKAGKSFTLTVETNPQISNSYAYAWYKDGKVIPGATGASYTVNEATEADTGKYYVMVTNTQDNTQINSSTCVVKVDASNNVAIGKKVTATPLSDGQPNANMALNPANIGKGLSLLTDGNVPSETLYTDANIYCTHVQNGSGTITAEFVIDLEETFDIAKVSYDTVKSINGVNQITAATIYTSTDGATWTQFGDPISNPNQTDGWKRFGVTDTANARYVKLVVGGANRWFTLGEIMVETPPKAGDVAQTPIFNPDLDAEKVVADLGDEVTLTVAATGAEGALITYQWYKKEKGAANGTAIPGATAESYAVRPLVSGDVYYVIATAEESGKESSTAVSTECTVKINSDLINFALNKPYTYAENGGPLTDEENAPWTGYPDTDNKELTDGNIVTELVYANPGYIGVPSKRGLEVVIDLGAAKDVSKVKVFSMSPGESGIQLPSAATVFTSTDGTNFDEMGSWAIDPDIDIKTTAASIVISVAADTPVSARYVKVVVPSPGMHFFSEIMVLGTEGTTPPVPDDEPSTPAFTTDLREALEAEAGSSVTLKVAATANGALSYQWYKGDAAIDGATNATYTIDAVQASDAGSYKVIVTNTLNDTTATATSKVCVLTVKEEENNILKGLKYTTSLRDGDANKNEGNFGTPPCDDVSRTKLTNGLYSPEGEWQDENTVGYHGRSQPDPQPVDIEFHLGDTAKTFSEIKISSLGGDSGIKLPKSITVRVRNGENGAWETICEFKTPEAELDSKQRTFVFATAEGKTVTATDIHFDFAPGSAWVFLDEIEVLKDREPGLAVDGPLKETTTDPGPGPGPGPDPVVKAPTITTDLNTTMTAKVGEKVTFTVAATSEEGTLSYQWYKDNRTINGATSASYTIDSVQKANEGSYKVVVTNTLDSTSATATSKVCVLTVEDQTVVDPKAPTIITNLNKTYVTTTGTKVILTVEAVSNNNGTLTYQWYKGGRAISGATSATYTMDAVSTTDSGVYYVDVMDTSNNTHVASVSCTVTVRSSGSSGGGSYVGGGSTTTKPGVPTVGTWKELPDGTKQYLEGNKPVTGWKTIQGKQYYFNSQGTMQTGWFKDGANWYYLGTDGTTKYGWQQIGSSWYYLKNNGAMATGWQQVGSTWYYLKNRGAMATGWLQQGNTWYYLKSSGAMATGWLQQGDTWYYLKSSGAMATGWFQLGNTWYRLNSDGSMVHNQWMSIGGKYYYFYASGAMASNTTVGGYKVDASGQWIQ